MSTTARLRAEIEALLANGPLDEDELFDALGDFNDHSDEFADLVVELVDELDVVYLHDGRVVDRGWLFEGAVARHRLSDDDVAREAIEPEDFLPAILGADAEVFWEDSELSFEEMRIDGEMRLCLVAPRSFWKHHRCGDELQVRFDGRQLVLEDAAPLDPPSTGAAGAPGFDDLAATLRDAGEQFGYELEWDSAAQMAAEPAGDDEPDESGRSDIVDSNGTWAINDVEAIQALLVEHHDAFRAGTVPPLTQIIERAGMRWSSPWIGGPGTSESGLAVFSTGMRLIEHHGGSAEDAEAVGMAFLLYGVWSERVAEEDFDSAERILGSASEIISVPEVAEVLGAFAVGSVSSGFADFARALGNREELSAGDVWLAAQEAFSEEHTAEALGLLSAARGAFQSPDWDFALEQLATLELMRGDLAAATDLFQSVGEPQIAKKIAEAKPALPKGIGRNSPCPCGSGIKFKKCCGTTSAGSPLESRVALLWFKAQHYCHEHHSECLSVGDMRLLRSDPITFAGLFELAVSAHLFEDGAIDELAEVFTDLLPEDEKTLLAAWSAVERCLFEVLEVRPGAGLLLRDVGTGDRVEVKDRPGSESLQPGELVLAIAVPTGGALDQLLGAAIPIPHSRRDACLAMLDSEPLSDDLVEFVASMAAPPQLRNTEGQELVFREITWRVGDPQAAVARLDAALGREPDDALRWTRTSEDSNRWIRWTLSLEGDELSGTANSDERWAELEAFVATELPDAELLDVSSSTMADAMRDHELFGAAAGAGGPADFEDDPELAAEVAAAMDQRIREMERAWCDESIPALGGATPREAADDPTRRDDLVRLLRSFARPPELPGFSGGDGGFDAQRLADLLGIDEPLL